MKRKPTPARIYPPGYFADLVAKHNWPPMFEPRLGHDERWLKRHQASQTGRELALSQGLGWGAGTMPMPRTPTHLAPGWMGERL